MTEEERWYRIPCICEDCGCEPTAYRNGDTYCALHGRKLVSEADLDEQQREAEAEDEMRWARIEGFDLYVEAGRAS